MSRFTVLHPGAMGASVCAALVEAGHDVTWVSEGRSEVTVARAAKAGATTVTALVAAVAESDAVVSVCPPASAVAVAEEVAALGFAGVYLDANAVSPATSTQIARTVEAAGAHLVDGGIVGPPAWTRGTTRLYLSGPRAADAAGWFDGTSLDAVAVGPDVGAASALKMAYAGWTKGSMALLLAMAAYAESAGVGDALRAEWELSQPGLAARVERAAAGTGPKAWRFAGEMEEIASSLASAGLPSGFHEGAAGLYGRMSSLRDRADVELADVLGLVLGAAADD